MIFQGSDSGPYFNPTYFALTLITYSVFFSRLSRVTDVLVVFFILDSPALPYVILGAYVPTTELREIFSQRQLMFLVVDFNKICSR